MPAGLPVRKARKNTHNFLIYKFFVERFPGFLRSLGMTGGKENPRLPIKVRNDRRMGAVKKLFDGGRMYESLLESVIDRNVEAVECLLIELRITPHKSLQLRYHIDLRCLPLLSRWLESIL